jgi:hypothetical protein
MEVEHVLVRERGLGEVATAGVHDALGLAGRAAGVQQEQQLLAVHRLGRAIAVSGCDQVVVPVVAAVDHLDLVAAATDHDDVLDGRRPWRWLRRLPTSAGRTSPRR